MNTITINLGKEEAKLLYNCVVTILVCCSVTSPNDVHFINKITSLEKYLGEKLK